MSDHHEEEKPEGFLNNLFHSSIGGFAMLYIAICLISILMIVLFG
ncbi:MAG: hypothetical protein ACFB10_23430 [Salibacteraceae bacterium]